ncbi:outer membrane protein assembly factor BamA [bacterium]|nr:MAG: outer membrane protein assembly factor BamA [bacterium]
MKRLLCFLLVAASLLLPVISAAVEDSGSIQGRKIQSVAIENRSMAPDAEIYRLLLIKPGDSYDFARVAESLSFISRLPTVKNVVVNYKSEGEGIRLLFDIVPEPLIRKITFTGMTGLKEEQVLARLDTRIDEPVYLPFLESDRKEIARLYSLTGYSNVKITTGVQALPVKHWVAVEFLVEEGEPDRITSYGNMGDSGEYGLERVLSELDLRLGDVPAAAALREGVENLLADCWKNGYPEATVVSPGFERTEEGTILNLPLELGARTEISIVSANGGLPGELSEIKNSRLGEPITEQWVTHLQKALTEALYGKGYALAKVSVEDSVTGDPRKLKFIVTTGPAATLVSIVFEGNMRVGDEDLKERMESLDGGFFSDPPYILEDIEKTLPALEGYYASMGMVTAKAVIKEAKISPEGKATVVIGIEEGDVYRFGKPVFETDASLTASIAGELAQIHEGESAAPAKLDSARLALLSELVKSGHLGATVKYKTSIDAAAQKVNVTFTVAGGPVNRIGPVIVSGNARTLPEVILRELTFKTGEIWNQQELLVSQRKLFRLGFFQDVRIEPLKGTGGGDSLPVIVRVRERNTGHLDYGFGYGTEEGFKAFLEMGHANIGGTGRSMLLRLDTVGQDRSASINYRTPWVFDYPYDLRLSLIGQHLEKESYSLESMAIQSWLDHDFDRFTKGSVLYTIERNILTDVAKDADPAVTGDQDYFLSAIGPVFIRDTRDDPFNPRSGARHTLEFQLAAPFLWSDVGFARYLASTSGFFQLGDYTFALLARGGYAETLGATENLPIDKRFFLGGRSTVRGFARDAIGPKASDGTPIGGDLMVNLKAEARFLLTGKVGGTLFWDSGQVWNLKDENPSPGDLRNAAGGGLRYITPVGPISLEVGFKLDRKEGESPNEWHFTIGNVF